MSKLVGFRKNVKRLREIMAKMNAFSPHGLHIIQVLSDIANNMNFFSVQMLQECAQARYVEIGLRPTFAR